MHLLFGDGVGILEELLHQMVVVFGYSLDQFGPPLEHIGHHIIGHRHFVKGHAFRFHMPDDAFHFDQVDHALEIVFGADRQLQRNGFCTQHLPHLVDNHQEVSARAVHLVHKTDPGHPVAIGLTPYRLALRLHTVNGREQRDQTIQHPHGTLHLDGEIHVTGSIDDIEGIFFGIGSRLTLHRRKIPLAADGSRGDRNTPLLLLLHPVGSGRTIMHLPDFVDHPGIAQDPLRSGCFTGIDMSRNAEVSLKF